MNLVNEAALMAARRNKRLVTMQEFEDAKDKVMMGAERRSTAMTQAEKELTAFHEAGHAILALNVPAADPLHKATIIPRGRALGMVMQLPEGDRYSMSYKDMISRLAIMMGGRIAEEIKFGKENITSGASYRTDPGDEAGARHGDALGLLRQARPCAGDNQEEVFLGHSVARTQNVSEETAQLIDAEVRRLIDEAYTSATSILTKKKKDWIALAEGLLEYETLSGEEIKQLLSGQKPSRDMGDDTPTSRGSAVPKAGAGKRKKGPEPEGGMEPQPQGVKRKHLEKETPRHLPRRLSFRRAHVDQARILKGFVT